MLRRLLTSVALGAQFAVAGSACTTLLPGSDRGTDASTGGGGDANSASSPDAGPGDVADAASGPLEAADATMELDGDGGPAVDGAASALTAYCESFGRAAPDCGLFPAECAADWLAYCSTLGEVLSPVYFAAQVGCVDPTSCCFSSDCWDAAVQDCIDRSASDASPTPSWSLLGQDYCATCSVGAEACDAVDFGAYSSIAYSDSIARRIDAQCTGASLAAWAQSSPSDQNADCLTAFADCEASVISDAWSTPQSDPFLGCLLDAGAVDAAPDADEASVGVVVNPHVSDASAGDASCVPVAIVERGSDDGGSCDGGDAGESCVALVQGCEAGVERRVVCNCGVCTCTVDGRVVATLAQSSCGTTCCEGQCPF
jgi:hypothetical protein